MHSSTTQPSGLFDAADVTPGGFVVRVEADGYLLKVEPFNVVANQTTALALTLVSRPRSSLVTVTRKEIRIKRAIFFVTGSSEIEARSNALMTEIADVMMRNPQVQRVEIQGHTDNVGGAEDNRVLSQARADSVRAWLINAGVESDRLEAKGYGPDRPLVPNLTPGNRARNRRVQFIIRDQATSP
jgi:outer membrane protein OmpA-like peptidoglycan-associated protein